MVSRSILTGRGFKTNGQTFKQDVYTRGIFYQASPTTPTDFEVWA